MVVAVAVAMAEGDMGKARPRGTAAVKTPFCHDPRDKTTKKLRGDKLTKTISL